MLEDGDRYVLYSSDTLYRLTNSSCVEGSSVSLQNQSVTRFRLIEGKWYAQDIYQLNNYSSTTYICHVYNKWRDFQQQQAYILPATIIVVLVFSCIYHWFLRLRG